MNTIDLDILLSISNEPYINQRILAEDAGYAVGTVNKSIRALMSGGYLDEENRLTPLSQDLIKSSSPENAIILAAGLGMRMVPINTQTPKGLLEINGEPLIERQIKQLQSVGIIDIHIVVGFMKEQYEYLIDKYGVHLTVNIDYATKNNLHSVALAAKYISNTYIVPCDIWCGYNPFSRNELYSWYMVTDLVDDDSDVRVNRKNELVKSDGVGNSMVGIAYITRSDSEEIKRRICSMDQNKQYEAAFWEEALYNDDRMMVSAKVVHTADVVEINTYEQLRELDDHSNQLKSDAIMIACQTLKAKANDIANIMVLKKGMTNRSFLFDCKEEKYVMRIPGEGTDELINRAEEAEVYSTIAGKGICDDLVYVNPENGYKIAKFIPNVKVCDAENENDLVKCMEKLRVFHQMKLKVDHSFDIFGMIDYYESLWDGTPSVYKDYLMTKSNVLSLRAYLEEHAEPFALAHIDAVPDNFLFSTDETGNESLQLIDWEYAGMQDQDLDLAMFSIYSCYSKEQADHLIDIYFKNNCPIERRIKIYCYMAISGLLWSNWCEYKRNLGVEFGEYSIAQYRYAKDFYRIVLAELDKLGKNLPEAKNESR